MNKPNALLFSLLMVSMSLAGCFSEVTGDYMEHISVEVTEIEVRNDVSWCGNDGSEEADGYCHLVYFIATNNNDIWIWDTENDSSEDEGVWTAITTNGDTYYERWSVAYSPRLAPGQTWDCSKGGDQELDVFKFSIPQHKTIEFLVWNDSLGHKIKVDALGLTIR
jgi:hypothetical protein